MPASVIAERVFTQSDQEQFAAFSGDWNPMHMDKVAARRTQPGAPVVHGVHLTLWALETLIRDGILGKPVQGIEATFVKFVYLDTPTTLVLGARDEDRLELTVVAAGVTTTSLTIKFDIGTNTALPGDYPEATTNGRAPNAPDLTAMASQVGWMPPMPGPSGDPTALFPHAARAIGGERVTAVALSSRLVGMLYPGLHSVFGSLSVAFGPGDPRPGIGFRVATANARTRMLKMDLVGSGVTGTVIAFARREAVAQAGMDQVAAAVGRDEFAGVTALITGGSRGLGALTAKFIAAGGGDAIVTYALGREDAEQLAAEINAHTGRQSCTLLRYDMMASAAEQLGSLSATPTHLYHFASPRIYRQKTALFDAALFAEFTQAYLTSFQDLCAVAQARATERVVAFYPSTVFVEPGRPADMTEYAMVKAAGEVLADEMSKSESFPLVVCRRLPRMLTDQTATLVRVQTEDAFTVMLPVVRAVQTALTQS